MPLCHSSWGNSALRRSDRAQRRVCYACEPVWYSSELFYRSKYSTILIGIHAVDTLIQGGFSNNFARPSYQAAVVETYLTDFDPGYPYYFGSLAVNDVNTTLGLYNRAGRAYPDVSANGAYLRAWLDQVDYHWFGTSLAAPIWFVSPSYIMKRLFADKIRGSVMTLINGQRLLKGKKTVGFVNPVLYANPGAMNDIVNGTNVGCGSEGFKAAKGYVLRNNIS